MGTIRVSRTDMGDARRTKRVAEVWSVPGSGYLGAMSPSLAMKLGLCEREPGTYRRTGTLTFTPEGEEADGAREERVVEVGPTTNGRVRQFVDGELVDDIPYTGSQVMFWLRTNAPGRYAVSHRRLPDPPKPVAEGGA